MKQQNMSKNLKKKLFLKYLGEKFILNKVVRFPSNIDIFYNIPLQKNLKKISPIRQRFYY